MFKLSIFKNEDNSEKLREKYHGADSLPLKVSIKAGWRMIKLFWGSKDSLFAWFLLLCIVALTGGAIYLAKVINTWYKEFWDTIQNYDLEGFKYQLMVFVVLATIHVVVSVYNSYLRSKLAIHWRKWFTSKVIHDYIDADTYYKMQLEDRKTENPDQRISEDLNGLLSTISTLDGHQYQTTTVGTDGATREVGIADPRHLLIALICGDACNNVGIRYNGNITSDDIFEDNVRDVSLTTTIIDALNTYVLVRVEIEHKVRGSNASTRVAEAVGNLFHVVFQPFVFFR